MAVQTCRSGFAAQCPTVERYGWDHPGAENFYAKWGYREAEVIHIRGVSGGDVEIHDIISNGTLAQADLVAASGVYGKAPLGSTIRHYGAKPVILLRCLTSNGTYADWVDASGVAASTIINA